MIREGTLKKERDLLELKTKQVHKGRQIEASREKQAHKSSKPKKNLLIAVAADNRLTTRDSKRFSNQVSGNS